MQKIFVYVVDHGVTKFGENIKHNSVIKVYSHNNPWIARKKAHDKCREIIDFQDELQKEEPDYYLDASEVKPNDYCDKKGWNLGMCMMLAEITEEKFAELTKLGSKVIGNEFIKDKELIGEALVLCYEKGEAWLQELNTEAILIEKVAEISGKHVSISYKGNSYKAIDPMLINSELKEFIDECCLIEKN